MTKLTLTRKTLTFKAIGRTADLEVTHTFKTKNEAVKFLSGHSVMQRDVEGTTIRVSERSIKLIASDLSEEVEAKNEIQITPKTSTAGRLTRSGRKFNR